MYYCYHGLGHTKELNFVNVVSTYTEHNDILAMEVDVVLCISLLNTNSF